MKIFIHDMISPYLSLINIALKIKFGQNAKSAQRLHQPLTTSEAATSASM
jgi:hypothetical protein